MSKGLSFSSHSAVAAGFGEHFAKTGLIDSRFHRYLIDGQETRARSDYEVDPKVTETQASEQITRAEQFIQVAEQFLSAVPP